MKAFGLDTNKEYSDAELDAAIAHANQRCNYWCRQVVVATYILCAGMVVSVWVYHGLTKLRS